MSCIKFGQTSQMRKTLKPRVWLERLTAANGDSTQVELIVARGLRVLTLREAVHSIKSWLSFTTFPQFPFTPFHRSSSFTHILSCHRTLAPPGRRRRLHRHPKCQSFSRRGDCSRLFGSLSVHGHLCGITRSGFGIWKLLTLSALYCVLS